MNGKKYSEWCEHYDLNNEEMKFLKKNGVDFNGSRVLEVGCGTGRFTKRILPFVSEILCVDPDENAISVFKTELINPIITTKLGTLETIELRESYFDYVVFSWSMYLIQNKKLNLEIAKKALKKGGKLVILQANTGEYESEIAKLYSSYSTLDAYNSAYAVLEKQILNVFGNVTTDILKAYFTFDSIDQIIDKSIFFIEDEEGQTPSVDKIKKLKKRLIKYKNNEAFKLSDIVSAFFAVKK